MLGECRSTLVKWLLDESLPLRRVVFEQAKLIKPDLVLPEPEEAARICLTDVTEDAEDAEDERV